MKRMISLCTVLVLLVSFLLPAGAAAAENPVPVAKQAVVRIASGIYFEGGSLRTYDRGGSYSSGTAFGVYAENGGALVFATNGHVVSDDYGNSYDFVYICIDGANVRDESTMIKADVLYVDNRIDVAIIKAAAPVGGVGVLPLRPSEEMETGDTVYALGFPGISDEVADSNNYTTEDITVTDGIISRYMTNDGVKVMASTAKVNHGNSGGPLINESGEAIGINTFIHADRSTADLRCYAIYIDYVMEAMDSLGIPYNQNSVAPVAPTVETQPQETAATEPQTQPGGTLPGKQTEETKPGFFDSEYAMPAVIVGAVILVLLGVIVLLVIRRRKNVQDPAATRIQGPDVLVCAISGPMQGQVWKLGAVLTIGRDYGCSIVYPADTKGISRTHCRIDRRGDEILLTDLGSTYGTYVGGRKLNPNMPVRIFKNTEIWLGGDKIRLVIR